jgi:hypothetical protein
MSETLLNEIRSTRPAAPESLRERVRELAAQKPAREPFLARLEWKRLVLVAPATLVVALVVAGVIGLTRDDVGAGQRDASGGSGTATALAQPESAARAKGAPATALDAATLPPATGRLQRYEAELSLRVDDVEALSSATKRAQQIALSVGGHVASLQYDAPNVGVGSAQLTLRVPTARIETAMAQLSALGTITGQRYGIQDLQVQADDLQQQLEQTQRRIAQILTQLESPRLSAADRAVLQSRLNASRQRLAGLREAMRATTAEAKTATVYLTLATEEIAPGAANGSRVDNVKDVLAWEAIALLYALVVAGPFVLLGLLTWFALRLRRRREEALLLAK